MVSLTSLVAANIVTFIVGYIVVGILFTFIKWTLSLFKIKRDLEGMSEDFIKRFDNRGGLNSARRAVAHQTLECAAYPPTAKENVSWLVLWAIFWPIVMIWSMFKDVIVEVTYYSVRKFQSIYQRIANSILPE
jgi:hypothetical protein